MRDETVARSYAETLFALAEKQGALETYGQGIETVARLLDEDPRFRTFLETPRISAEDKKAVLRKAFGSALPRPLLNFLLITIDKRRQRLLREISRSFHGLIDERLGRTHVEVTVAHALDTATLEQVGRRLTQLLGKTAIPHVRVKPEILGGLVVRTGDTVYDGSLRRGLDRMRRRLLAARLPAAEAAGLSAPE